MKRGISVRLFDLHCDTLYECAVRARGDLCRNTGALDLTRGLALTDEWVQAFAVWTPDNDLHGAPAFRRCCRMLRWAHQQCRRYADRLDLVCNAKQLYTQTDRSACQMLLTVEGGHALGGDLRNIPELAKLQVKVITLTWNGENELGYGAVSGTREGLKPFGMEAVAAMEAHRIVVDVSHLNERGFWDVAEHATRPFIASHSVSAAVHPHPRNLTDAQFDAIRDRGGLAGISLCAAHLGGATPETVERHAEHFWARGGERTVAIGTDLDGTDLPPEWDGIAFLPRLYEHFLRKNYPESLLDRLFFGNSYDFFKNALQN